MNKSTEVDAWFERFEHPLRDVAGQDQDQDQGAGQDQDQGAGQDQDQGAGQDQDQGAGQDRQQVDLAR